MKAWQRLGRKFRAFGIASLGGSSLIALRTYRFSVIADDQNKNSTPLRIAIIGSGVGGASTAYFLRESLNQKCPKRPVTMDVFEKNDYAGGRVYGVNLEAYSGGMLMKDVGATIIIKENQYMMHFGKDLLNLEMVNENDLEDKKGFAFFDEPRGKLSAVWDEGWGTLQLIKHWGVLHFCALMMNARGFKDGKSFDSALDLWTALNLGDTLYGNGMEYVNKEINKYTPSWLGTYLTDSSDEKQYAPSTLQLVTALTRNNYTQNPEDLPPIVCAGAVSTLAANGLCFVANGGNSLIEKGLIEMANANLHLNSEIKSITKNMDEKYILNGDRALEYDYCIIAAPLCSSNISFDIDSNPKSDCNRQIEVLKQQKYVDVHRHYVKGKLSTKYLGFDEEDPSLLENVGTVLSSNYGGLETGKQRVTHKKLPFTTLGQINGTEWIAFMGADLLTGEILDEVMSEWEKDSLQKYSWKAYPEFRWNRNNIDCLPLEEQRRLLSFCVDKSDNKGGGLYYLNVLECGMSAQEVMAVAGKNVALLVSDQIVKS